MQKDILKFIKSQGGVWNAAKFFGGMHQLLKFVKNDTELYNKILSDCSGKIFFHSDSGNNHEFDILVTGFDISTEEEGYTNFLTIDFDLKVKNKKFERKIADWVQSYADDLRMTYTLSNPAFRKFDHISGFIISVNGKPYDDPSPGFNVPDEEIEPILGENVIPYIKKLQNLFD